MCLMLHEKNNLRKCEMLYRRQEQQQNESNFDDEAVQ